MWNLSKLEIHGLQSFGDAEIDFVEGEVVVIYGKNLDVGQEKSNGSGKSAFLEGIGFGVTGSPLRKIKIGELVNDDAKSAQVSITLTNKGLGEDMLIERIAYRSKSSVAKVFINGDEVVDKTSTDEINKFIADKIGISREDLLNFFILTASKFTPFLDSSDTKKKEVINRFSNGVIVDKSISDLEEDKVDAVEELSEIKKQHSSLSATLEALESTLFETENRKPIDSTREISNLNGLIDISKRGIKHLLVEIDNDNLDLQDIIDEISELPTSDLLEEELGKAEENLEARESVRQSIRSAAQELKHNISHIELRIKGSIDCPKCGHEFDPTDKAFDVSDAENSLDKAHTSLSSIIENGVSEAKKIDSIKAAIGSLNSRISKISQNKIALNKERFDIERDISSSKSKIADHKNKIESYGLKIEGLSTSNESDAVTPLKNKIASTQAKFKPVDEKLSELSEEVGGYDVQLDVFKRFKSHLANMSLKSMEALTNDFLCEFGSDIFIQLTANKRLANNKTSEKISSILVRNGIDIGSFGKRSGGEKALINLSFAKTLSSLINMNAGDNKGLNLLVIDEILDASDAEGMTSIVRALEKQGETSILITHIPLPASVGRAITVVKENDLSRIDYGI